MTERRPAQGNRRIRRAFVNMRVGIIDMRLAGADGADGGSNRECGVTHQRTGLHFLSAAIAVVVAVFLQLQGCVVWLFV